MREDFQTVGHRRFSRFPVTVLALGRAPQFGETELLGTVRNISGGGLMAEFPVHIVPESRVRLVLHTRRGPLPLKGHVVWADPSGNATRHGIAFEQPKGHDFAMELFISETR
jgi:hypothetical protein